MVEITKEKLTDALMLCTKGIASSSAKLPPDDSGGLNS